jgi:hydroxymethylpyrimidine kinase / phosphomethylpyrimidine kinase / thiamine-phosphate diphosphorylase
MVTEIRPVIAVIGGSDSAGLAGIQMDSRCAQAMGVHAATVISTVTAQNNDAVYLAEPVSDRCFNEQLQAIQALPVRAIKIGVLANHWQLILLCDWLKQASVPVIWDPVQISTSGGLLSELDSHLLLESLLPLVSLITPNLLELQCLTGQANPEQGGDVLIQRGVDAVLVKGGHGEGSDSTDYYRSQTETFHLNSLKRDTMNSRGTGCALATAVCAALALEYELSDSVVIAKAAINQGLRHGYSLDFAQRGPIQIRSFPDELQDMPLLRYEPGVEAVPTPFPDCGTLPLGLYPIVDRAVWLERLLPLGITTVQLRIKDLTGDALRAEIHAAVSIARDYQCRLFINDYWQLAIEYGAYGVHLGQEDLHDASLAQIHAAGLRLGVSSHCHYEVARALAIRPSYIACGPVYPTRTKQMPWRPLGIDGLQYWQRLLRDYPVVAIGGINQQRMVDVRSTGVSGIAMISAITQADEPERACSEMLDLT